MNQPNYRFAQNTTVSVAKSKAEIEDLVTKYGATSFATMSGRTANGTEGAAIVFEAQGRRVRFELVLPPREDFATRTLRGRRVKATPEQQLADWEQACRQRWRALALVIKAKLEAVATGITEFETEFLAHIVLPGGGTVGQWMAPQLAESYATGKLPPLLGAGSGT